MSNNRFSRRTVLQGIGGTATGSALLRSVSTPASAGENYPDSDKDAVVSAPNGAGQNVLATLNQYPGTAGGDRYGTLIEDTSAFRRDVEHLRDVHTILWDADLGQTLDVRNDAAGSEVSYESSTVPEVHVHNWFQFDSGYSADLYQDVLVTADKPALLVQNNAQFDQANDHTLFTLVNPAIDEFDSRGEGDSGYVTTANGYDCVVASDGSWYLAYAQQRPSTGKTTFDGHRVGVEGSTSGSDKSAWHDIYGENDGYIDANSSASGNVDSGVGLYVGGATDVTWLTAIGFGKSESEAIDNATAALDNGYAAERNGFVSAWDDWHASVSSGPTGDATADAMYEKSLTSLKCAQDPRGPMIAGAFEPGSEEYTYVWPRDQVVMIQSLLSADATTEAREALQWLDDHQIKTATTDDRGIDREGTWWQNYYVDGSAHWEALQLDQVGGPIYAHWLTWQETGDSAVLDDHYSMSKSAGQFLLGYDNGYGFPKKHQDPWEEIWGYSTEGTASAIAGLRAMAELADAKGETAFADDCRNKADTWASNFDGYCYKTNAYLGDHYVTADSPTYNDGTLDADVRPDAAAFMAAWPWNVKDASSPEMTSTVQKADDTAWKADDTPCLGRYPQDDYTPSGSANDGGWPLCEAYADVVRWQSGVDSNAMSDYVFDHAEQWTTAAGLLPERVDGNGDVQWNSNLQWSQAMYLLLVESDQRGAPFGLAPSS
ncbi:glycoside hydrolase family 15 protein [Halorussus pelagicus]|uniref:glycoside hydrolase family 15 protein n=1 Tax=Halorussus pelagicus TaxID=2505977 RepID=UPI000FFBC455|nr:glycoside hydrolase family 15 protein [Halorussus pelagicus]